MIAAASDGALWFTDPGNNEIRQITTDGNVTRFPIQSVDGHPVGITAGPDGALWFTEYNTHKIGRITTPTPTGFYTVTPCRVLDTRGRPTPITAPQLSGGSVNSFVLTGQCGVPPGAKAVSINVTITQPSAAGDLRLYPAGVSSPLISTINYRAGHEAPKGGDGIVGARLGDIAVLCDQASGTAVQLPIDVNGYFEQGIECPRRPERGCPRAFERVTRSRPIPVDTSGQADIA
jgi:hypothetical protein